MTTGKASSASGFASIGNDDQAAYERGEISAIASWKAEPPSVISKVVGAIAAPVVAVVQSVIPATIIETAIEGADWLAETTITPPNSSSSSDLRDLDRSAKEVKAWALGLAGAIGGGGGAAGLPAMAIEIPAVVVLALRTIRATGACYGYGGAHHSEYEREFVLSILSQVGANDQMEKATAVATLAKISSVLHRETIKAMAVNTGKVQLAIVTVRNIARSLSINLTKRKMLQAIPVVGAVVGALTNISFIQDVAVAARRAYQERWLKDNGRWIEEVD